MFNLRGPQGQNPRTTCGPRTTVWETLVYANIGGMISSPLCGILMDYASKDKGYTDFS
jgi:hypothetical protein